MFENSVTYEKKDLNKVFTYKEIQYSSENIYYHLSGVHLWYVKEFLHKLISLSISVSFKKISSSGRNLIVIKL